MNELALKIPVKGEVAMRMYEQKDLPMFWKLWNKTLERLDSAGLISRRTLKKYYKLGELVQEESWKHNVICNAGFNALARRLANDNTYSCNVNKMGLGTGSGAFDGNETQMYTETYRNNIASYTASGAIAYLDAYFTETEVTGTFTEFASFIDGGSGANTGVIFDHKQVAWTKTVTNVLAVDIRITFANG